MPRAKDGLDRDDVERIIESIARAMVAEEVGALEVDWELVAEVLEGIGLEYEEALRRAEERRDEVRRDLARVRTLRAWIERGHRLRGP